MNINKDDVIEEHLEALVASDEAYQDKEIQNEKIEIELIKQNTKEALNSLKKKVDANREIIQ